MSDRDFGIHTQEVDGVWMTCRYYAPGLTRLDLEKLFQDAAKGGNKLAGNPAHWPTSRGIKAVADAIMDAMDKHHAEEITRLREKLARHEAHGYEIALDKCEYDVGKLEARAEAAEARLAELEQELFEEQIRRTLEKSHD